jgi:hypothetical protein
MLVREQTDSDAEVFLTIMGFLFLEPNVLIVKAK